MKTIIALILCLFLFIPSAQALRCKSGRLVNVGDTKYQVLKRCGEPTYTEFVGVGKVKQYVNRKMKSNLVIEVWTYDSKQLEGSWDYQIFFLGSEIVAIEHVSEY